MDRLLGKGSSTNVAYYYTSGGGGGGGGHCIGDCTPTSDRGQSEGKRSRQNFEAGQAVKLESGGSLIPSDCTCVDVLQNSHYHHNSLILYRLHTQKYSQYHYS